MENAWFERLITAIENDPRSKREISLAARCGSNYVQQMIKERKEPGSDRLARLLEVLGTTSGLYVLTGVKVDAEDLEFLHLISSLPDNAKAHALEFFAALAKSEDAQ